MGTAITVIIILLVIVGIIALVAVSGYNGFVKSRNQIQESWRQIDVELNRRYELIPNLVETVRAYAAHERNTLEDITRLRSQAQQLAAAGGLDAEPAAGRRRGRPVRCRAQPHRQCRGVPGPEEQPELPRVAAPADRDRGPDRRRPPVLQRQRPGLQHQDRIGADQPDRERFKFEKATYFEVNEPAVRSAPDVSFGEIAYRGDPQQPAPAAASSRRPLGPRRAAESAGLRAARYASSPRRSRTRRTRPAGGYSAPQTGPAGGSATRPRRRVRSGRRSRRRPLSSRPISGSAPCRRT